MARSPKPWYWKARKAWFVTIAGVRHFLSEDKKEAELKFHQMMAIPTQQSIRGDTLVILFDQYLTWTKRHRSRATFNWYQRYLQEFIQTIPAHLTVGQLKPYHVQNWVDSDADKSSSTRRAKIRSVKRALNWAKQQGYINSQPLAGLTMPEDGRRDRMISEEEYAAILAATSDTDFQNVIITAWETGARPQEITAVEARHVDLKHSRWIFPREEAKGKKRPRVIYLTPVAETITLRLMKQFPEGPLFRNSEGTPWKKDAINCRFSRLKATLKTKYCLYHFRHSFATRKLKSGVDPLTVAELLGHADPSMLAKVYQHLSHDPSFMLEQLRRSAS